MVLPNDAGVVVVDSDRTQMLRLDLISGVHEPLMQSAGGFIGNPHWAQAANESRWISYSGESSLVMAWSEALRNFDRTMQILSCL